MENVCRQQFIAFISLNSDSNTEKTRNSTLLIDVLTLLSYHCKNYERPKNQTNTGQAERAEAWRLVYFSTSFNRGGFQSERETSEIVAGCVSDGSCVFPIHGAWRNGESGEWGWKSMRAVKMKNYLLLTGTTSAQRQLSRTRAQERPPA